jgi:hypothetical protein
MTRLFTAVALTGVVLASASAAAELLTPGSGHSIRLGAYDGVVYYTVEQDGYRVVATLASGPDAPPLRVISKLAPGQRIIVSMPRPAGQPPLDLEIVRNGDALVVDDASSASTVEFTETPTSAALEK